ncbi:cytochrome c oxidase accessory protein CcoG [Stakelama tenebrarum]|uniref:Cytochrome c oxidase accessory protein CcoG n=1 Tax=Stakelama tenebrarum TaxID=2711215 RepID=A0A6G6YBS1_9SPHN|nr:cytochrome c oxidase accessory protein CcoG [Sphingosinithalassobacter tenebrarum]QIG82033.1 cytochrome c oxidase accessory protein CcoG [Sphingosinithalassobacter tenebrarum]
MSSPSDLTGEKQQFFEARKKVFPRKVNGTYRRLKWVIMAVTLTIYYVTPWLRWDRGPYAPDQAVLIDLANRRFYMFSIEIWPNEFYYVVGLLVMAAIGLFLVTSAVGRAWCGYACPQTVWTDLFVHVERLVEGDRNAQIRLDKAPWGAKKIGKRGLKYAIWLYIAAATGGAWIWYFADAPTLFMDFIHGTAPFAAYAAVGILTFTTFTLGGFMREQVCIYMCPWPRIQGAMMDEKSLGVTYKYWRGEPRTHGLKRAHAQPLTDLAEGEKVGDCIDCNACVAVCPTGIDIREGPQIGCITCGLCIDACDEIMAKVGREPKLIGYATAADEALIKQGKEPVSAKKRLLRPRTLIYFLLWCGVGLGMLFVLGNRARIGIDVLQTRNPLWVQLADGSIRNTYTLKIRNMEARPRTVEITVDGIDAVLWNDRGSRDDAAQAVRLEVPADKVAKTQLFVAAPGAGPQRTDVVFTVRALDQDGASASDESFFERPEGSR